MYNPNCTAKDLSLYLECCQPPRKNGGEYSQKWITFSIVMTNSFSSSSTCSAISPMRQHFSLFLILSVTKSHKPKSTLYKNSSRLLDLIKIYIFIEKPYIILSRDVKWKWWRYHQKMASQKRERSYPVMEQITNAASTQRQRMIQLGDLLGSSKTRRLLYSRRGSILVRHLDLMCSMD